MQRIKSFFSSRFSKEKENNNQSYGPKVKPNSNRCPLNHKCVQYTDGRRSKFKKFLPKHSIICDLCQDNLGPKKCFYSCISCDYDICDHCHTNFEKIKALQPAPIVEFKDTDGDRITLQQYGNRVVLKVNGQEKAQNLKSFNINIRTRKYRDDTGVGNVPNNVNIIKLKQSVSRLFQEVNPEYPTAVHNPNWEFVQNTTIANIITTGLGDDCSFDLAITIASFVVERSVTVETLLYDNETDDLIESTKYILPAQQSVLEALKVQLSYGTGRRLTDCYIMEKSNDVSCMIPDQSQIDQMLNYGRGHRRRQASRYGDELMNDTPWNFRQIHKNIENINEAALVGDVFCWNNVILIGTLEPEIDLSFNDTISQEHMMCSK